MWWPNLNTDVEIYIKKCHPCQVVSPLEKPTPLKMTPIPPAAWLMVDCDLCGPFPSGENLLVCVDYYSRFPEVEILHEVSAKAIISKLRKLFCRYGAPEELVTDNGPQFISQSFKDLMKEFGIKHRRVTPYYPQSNGEVEPFNRTLKKAIHTAIAEGTNWRVALQSFLLSYRNTPHSTTGVAPSELMFGRPFRDKLPGEYRVNKTKVNQRDKQKKAAAKAYGDEKRFAKSVNIKVGEDVLIANNKQHRNKFESRWEHQPGQVLSPA